MTTLRPTAQNARIARQSVGPRTFTRAKRNRSRPRRIPLALWLNRVQATWLNDAARSAAWGASAHVKWAN